jgi:hypothetical protein
VVKKQIFTICTKLYFEIIEKESNRAPVRSEHYFIPFSNVINTINGKSRGSSVPEPDLIHCNYAVFHEYLLIKKKLTAASKNRDLAEAKLSKYL